MSSSPTQAAVEQPDASGAKAIRREFLALALIMVLASSRVAATFPVFAQIYDEPAHLAGGIEWLDRHTFTTFVQNPPLPRILVALGPYLDGARFVPDSAVRSGNAVLYARDYSRTLSLARSGNLVFLLLSILIVWQITRRIFGPWAGLTGAALFSLLPPILGNAGVATADMAAAAMVGVSVAALISWLDAPGAGRAIWLGASFGLAMISKFSALFFLPLCVVSFVACYLYRSRNEAPLLRLGARRLAGQVALSAVSGFLVVWAGYWFSWAPASKAIELVPAGSTLVPAFRLIERIGLPIPAPEFVAGLTVLFEINRLHFFPSYFMGAVSRSGHLFFYPVVLAVKTPISFLLVALAGAIVLLRDARRFHWAAPAIGLSALALMLVSMTFAINTGVRHILVIHLLLAVYAGAAVLLWRSSKWMVRVLLGLVVASLLSSSIASHPDYMAYFNVLAGDQPERISIVADLDWGQDLLRVKAAVEKHNIDHLWLAYHGSAVPGLHDLGTVVEPLQRGGYTSGWIAISEAERHPIFTNGYSWLASYEPVDRIGKSIWLYRIP